MNTALEAADASPCTFWVRKRSLAETYLYFQLQKLELKTKKPPELDSPVALSSENNLDPS